MKTKTLHIKKRLRVIFTLILIVSFSFNGFSQTLANYSFAASSGTYTALSSPTYPTLSAADDGFVNSIPIGFDFWYMGTKYTTVGINTNGFVSFGTITVADATNSLTSLGARPLLAPLWDDLSAVTTGSNISYKNSGSAPNRTFTVEYNDMKWNYNAAGAVIDFQVILYESTGVIKFVYNQNATAYNSGTSGASIGLTATATGSNNYMSLSGSGASPTTSVSSETSGIATKPANNQTYTFTPPSTLSAPTSLTFTSVSYTGMTLNWTASSPTTNIVKYAIYNSTDNSTFSYVGTSNLGTNTYAATGLNSTTTYYWKVYAISEGCLSTALTGNQATTTCAAVGGTASSSAASVAAVSTTVTLSLSGQTGTIQWQWSKDNSTYYDISGSTTTSETSPYISRATEYFRAKLTSGGCSSYSNVLTITSSAAAAANYWEGITSTNNQTSSNWSLNTVPSSSATDVLICKGTTYSPIHVSTYDIYANDFYVQETATYDYQIDDLSSGCWISGNVVVNGTIANSINGQGYFVMSGTSKTITVGASGNISALRLQVGKSGSTPSVTLGSNISVFECLIYTSGTLNVSTYTLQCKYFGNNVASATFNLNSGTLEIGGGTAYDKSGAHLTGKTNPYFESGTVSFGTGTVYYNAGEDYSAVDQTVKSVGYYNLKVRTNNGYIATLGGGSTYTISNNLEILNPSTAGGVATTANDFVCNGTFYLANSGNALILNLGHRLTRSTGASTTTFTMGTDAANVINVTYTHASQWAMSLGASAATSNLTFYGTVNYNNAAVQMVMASSYANLSVITGTSVRTLAGNTTITGILTISAGTLDVSASNYSITLAGDFVRADGATFTARSGTVTLNGAATQRVNVTSAAGTTPANSDITFYALVIASTDAKLYYNKTNDRYFNITDFTINSSKNAYLIGN
jgi:hypothetical protein